MPDRWAVAVAVSAALGATRPAAIPLVVAALAIAVGVSQRSWPVLCLGVAVLVSALSARAVAGLEGAPSGPVVASATLLTDPEPALDGVRGEARVGEMRVELRAVGAAADALGPRLAGEVVDLRGVMTPIHPPTAWSASRHLAARVRVHLVESVDRGGGVARATNRLREVVARGAGALDDEERSLYLGMVLGDDRQQSAQQADDFRGAGLTHLLAVSGQNVAFVLAIVGPVLRRLRLWPRAAATLATIGLFAALTRFEPSVLRASAMAGVATLASTAGTPASRVRVLALAVTGLLVIDPLLIRSIGFQLSVAATTAIALLAPRLAEVIPGPALVREPLAVTVAAQLGVAPVAVAAFGPLPLAALPANLLAVPAAGLVMMWGLTAGVLAGVAEPLAPVLHLPTHVLVGWVAAVAGRSVDLPLGALHAGHLAIVGCGLLVACLFRSRAVIRRAALLVVGATALVAAAVVHRPAPLRAVLAPGVVRWHEGAADVIVLGGDSRSTVTAPVALEALRRGGVGTIDLLVLADAAVAADTAVAVARRHRIGATVAHPAIDVAGGGLALPQSGELVQVGALRLVIVLAGDRLVVEAR